MKPLLTTFDKQLLNIIQEQLPLAPRPFKLIADELNCSEEKVLAHLKWLKEQGLIRRMGAFFNSAKLDYYSTLVAVKVDHAYLAQVAEKINSYGGVTHNYERRGTYNLWFTLFTKTQAGQQQIIEEVRNFKGVEKVMNLPAKEKFKVNVMFMVE